MKTVTVAVIGMGGYGSNYVDVVLKRSEELGIECVAMMDVCPEKTPFYSEVKEKNIPVYTSLEALYEKHTPELVFISSPIQFHCRQTCYALEHGSNVLCEKPISATTEEAKKMIETAEKTGRFAAIGYQWSYNQAILGAKKDILAGKYGKPLNYKTIIGMRRGLNYYARNKWAAKIKDGNDYIFDSVANNSAAHYLHNLLFLAGDALNKAAVPETIEAEIYRGNEIENFDTITAKIKTANGVDIYYSAGQCIENEYAARAFLLLEKGSVEILQDGSVVGHPDGEDDIAYGDTAADGMRKAECAVRAVRGEDTITCDVNTALPHNMIIQYIQDNVEIRDVLDQTVLIDVAAKGEEPYMVRCVMGMLEGMIDCYENQEMLSTWFAKKEA